MSAPKISIIIPAYNAEEKLPRMLDSVKNQTFENYEVIIVNDGSTDGTQAVIDRYCEEDERFKCCQQENSGVSAARNLGLEKATGVYVVFYDADDEVPEKALQRLYNQARRYMADMVIGQLRVHQMNEEILPEHIEALALKEEIEHNDEHLCEEFTLCNKMFRREVIEENGLRFSKVAPGEDALFLFKFIFACKDSIAISRAVVYDYYRPSFWGEPNLKQATSRATLDNLIANIDELMRYVDAVTEQRLAEIMAADETEAYKVEMSYRWKHFRSVLLMNLLDQEIFGEYYRFLWNNDDKTFGKVRDFLERYKPELFPSDWSKLEEKNPDLRLHLDLMNPEELVETPILSVLISANLPKDKLNLILNAYYKQNFVAFEVIADEEFRSVMNEEFLAKKNLRFMPHQDLAPWKTAALKDAKGTHCIFVDEPIAPSTGTIEQLMELEREEDKTFASAPMLNVTDGEEYHVLDTHRTAFTNEFDIVKLRSKYNQLDYVWGNKVFKIKNLLAKKRLFEDNSDKDLDRLYNNSNYVKFHGNAFLTTLTDADILKHVSNPSVKLGYKGKLRKEERRLARIEKESKRIKTIPQRFKKWRNKKLRGGYKYLTLKIIFPLVYKWNARKPIEKNKVIFIVNRKTELPNAMTYLNSLLEKSGKFDIHIHYLLKLALRYRQQYKVDLNLIRDLATANYVFVDEATISIGGFTKRPETKIVQLWHGCGAFKKFGFSTADKIFGGNAKEQKRYPMYRNFDLVCVSSPEIVWAYEEAMQLEGQGNVKPVGVSRTDVFYQDDYKAAAKQRVIDAIPAAADKKIVLYAPTFRGRVAKAYGPDRFDYDKLYKALGEDYILVIKHHPLVKKLPEIPLEYRDTFAYDVTHTMEIEDLIIASDICISDYSSLIFEYSLLEKPIILFAYDLDTYFDWRGFYYDYFEMAPGPVLISTDEIIDYIVNIETTFDREKMHAFREKFMSACDGHSTERILAEVGLEL